MPLTDSRQLRNVRYARYFLQGSQMPSNFQLFIFPSQNGLGLKNFFKTNLVLI